MAEVDGDTAIEDKQLIERAKSGDTEAFGSLFERYEKPVIATAFSLLKEAHKSEVKDVVQKTFISAGRFLNKFDYRHSGGFERWLKTIAANICRDR